MTCAPSTTATFLYPASPFCHLLLSPNCAPAQQPQHLSPAQDQCSCGHVLLTSLDPQPPLVHRLALCLETHFPVWVPEAQRCQHLRVAAPPIPPSQFPKLVLPQVGPSPPLLYLPSSIQGAQLPALQLQISAPASAFSQVTAACLLATSDR